MSPATTGLLQGVQVTPLRQWPMSHIVMLAGVVLAIGTGVKVLTSAPAPDGHSWEAPGEWLAFITGMLTITFATKRATFKLGGPQDKP